MPAMDMPLEKLKSYTGINPKPADFDAYWDQALAQMHAIDPQIEMTPSEFQAPNAECFDMTFTGVCNTRVYAKYLRPAGKNSGASGASGGGGHPAIVQFHGWAMLNREAMMPTREQAQEASRIVEEARARLKGTLVIDYVPADYHSDYPKRCMGGWGSTGLNVTPDGLVLPCHAAQTIPSLSFDNVRDKRLADIWYRGDAFNAYRGEDWMQEPCRSCDRRKLDFGGCRCQAMAIGGDAAATDPVCVKSPLHSKMTDLAEALSHGDSAELVYRKSP